MRKILAWALALGLAFPGVSALADTQALSFAGGNWFASVGTPLPNTVGWTFSLGSDIMLTQLGFYDKDSNGLKTNHQVAIWKEGDRSLVASATITTFDTLSDGFRWNAVTPVAMTAGDYRIGALVNEDDYYYSGASTINTANLVTYTGAAYATGEFAFPDQVQPTGNGRFGPNFQFVTAVPEPSTVLLLLGGLIAVTGIARRRRRTS